MPAKTGGFFCLVFFFLCSGKRGSLALEDGCLTALKCYVCKSCLFSKTDDSSKVRQCLVPEFSKPLAYDLFSFSCKCYSTELLTVHPHTLVRNLYIMKHIHIVGDLLRVISGIWGKKILFLISLKKKHNVLTPFIPVKSAPVFCCSYLLLFVL